MTHGFDPEILQDFLTEATELLDEFENDLVDLEHTPSDPELLNKVFRALHTIKGSASFLALTALVNVAHAAESSLNAARNSEIIVTKPMMDLLLETTDILKVQFEELAAGQELTPARPELIAIMTTIGEGNQIETIDQEATQAGDASLEHTDPAAEAVSQSAADGSSTTAAVAVTISTLAEPPSPIASSPLALPPGKQDLLEFLADDLDETLTNVSALVDQLVTDADSLKDNNADDLAETLDQLVRSVDFFEFADMTQLADALVAFGEGFQDLSEENRFDGICRVRAILTVLHWQTAGLRADESRQWNTQTLRDRLETLLSTGHLDDADRLAKPDGDGDDANSTTELDAAALEAHTLATLAHDGVIDPEQLDALSDQIRAIADEAMAGIDPVTPVSTPEVAAPNEPSAQVGDASPANAPGAAPSTAPRAQALAPPEQTIRVEVGRLESLMNLVGELVLQKNRVGALARRVGEMPAVEQDTRELFGLAAADLDRVTADMQMAVMRTRMQPLDKLFGKYPRLIRDLASKTNKKIDLVIEGGDTEVDKSVLEELGDPMVHLMRNSADHGIEMPEDRIASGKPENGTITISASHAGSSVLVRIRDDGRGLSREKLGAKAVEKGLTTEAELETLSDRDVYRFILAPGFSTAEQVSDLSGRGVGMDVVSTNIVALGGSVDIDSTPGEGTSIDILIPLTVAIMPAMMVAISDEIYAIPLDSITEIVDTDQSSCSSMGGGRVLRLREAVIPVIDGQEAFSVPHDLRTESKFAVVLSQNDRTIGLLVSRMIGQQEIVIKPLGDLTKSGPISGATVRDDGGVSLIVDVATLLRTNR
jgi:two-component system chemotaxis sensor kinase CheA